MTINKIAMRAGSLLLGAALLLFTGCQPDNLVPEGAFARERELTIQATYEMPDLDTKTVRDANAKIYWTPGDAISLFYGSGTDGGSKFTALAETVSLTTNFSGTITAVTGGADIELSDTYFWGLYPYDETSSCDGQTVTMTIPAVQPGMDDTFAPGFAPSLGHSQGLMLSFRNIWSGFGFTVSQSGYQKLTFRGNNNEFLAGRAKIGIDENGLPKVVQIVDGIREVTLTAPDANGFVPGKYYYMQFFPITLEAGFTVEISNATKTGTYVYSDAMDYPRSTWKRAKNVDTRCQSFVERDVTRADFEDEHFANYVFGQFDSNRDGILSLDERNSATYISVRTDTVASVRGVEYFPNLTQLNVRGVRRWNNQTQQYDTGLLTSLDVSGNSKLRYLTCNSNQLTDLNLSKNPALQSLYCYYNQLTSLDLSNNTALQDLSCYNNQLTSLDLSNNTALLSLSCSYNPIPSIDISHNTELQSLQVNGLGLSNLDFSHNTKLTYLSCSSNNLTTVDVSAFPALTSLYVSYNPLTSFDISNNPALENLDCSGLSLTSLDVSHLSQLSNLSCYNNQLSAIDLSSNPKLQYFDGEYNLFTELDFSGNPLLTGVYCRNCAITDLNVNENAALEYLYCNDNQIETLDVSCNPSLYTLEARNNPLTTLYIYEGQTIQNEYLPVGVNKVVKQLEGMTIDENSFPDANFRAWVSANCDKNGDGKLTKPERMAVTEIYVCTDNIESLAGISNFPILSSLSCSGSNRNWDTEENSGQLATLDLSGNLSLNYLYCSYNQLTSLDLSQNVNLKEINCSYNKLSSLSLPANEQLLYLECEWNQLSSLNVSANPSLRSLYCDGNQISVLNLNNNPALQGLGCSRNPIASLDLSNNTALTDINLYNCSNLTSLDLSVNTSLTYIYAESCYSLQTLSLPESLLTISDWSFGSCTSLASVVIPASVISVGRYAFYNCEALTTVEIPSSVSSIGERAFYICENLQSITLRPTTPPVGGYRMFYATNNCPIYVPATSVDAYKSAEYWSDYADRIQTKGSGDNEDIGYDVW